MKNIKNEVDEILAGSSFFLIKYRALMKKFFEAIENFAENDEFNLKVIKKRRKTTFVCFLSDDIETHANELLDVLKYIRNHAVELISDEDMKISKSLDLPVVVDNYKSAVTYIREREKKQSKSIKASSVDELKSHLIALSDNHIEMLENKGEGYAELLTEAYEQKRILKDYLSNLDLKDENLKDKTVQFSLQSITKSYEILYKNATGINSKINIHNGVFLKNISTIEKSKKRNKQTTNQFTSTKVFIANTELVVKSAN